MQAEREKPQEVKAACLFMWITLVAGVVMDALLGSFQESYQGLFIRLFINGYLIIGISRGRNSARVLAVLLFLLALAIQAKSITEIDSAIIVFVSIAQVVTTLVAFLLLFSKRGSQWFALSGKSQQS